MADQTREEIVAALEAARAARDPLPTPIHGIADDPYRTLSGDELRRGHAVDAARTADAFAAYEYAGVSDMFLATKRGRGAGSWVAVVFGLYTRTGARQVEGGWRLYVDSDEKADALALDPSGAFATLLARYGMPYPSMGRQVYFVPVHTHKVSKMPTNDVEFSAELLNALQLRKPPGEDVDVGINAPATLDENGVLTMKWTFAINLSAYQRDVRARHR